MGQRYHFAQYDANCVRIVYIALLLFLNHILRTSMYKQAYYGAWNDNTGLCSNGEM